MRRRLVIEPNIITPPSYQVTSLAHLDLLVVVVDVVELCRDGTVVGGEAVRVVTATC